MVKCTLDQSIIFHYIVISSKQGPGGSCPWFMPKALDVAWYSGEFYLVRNTKLNTGDLEIHKV